MNKFYCKQCGIYIRNKNRPSHFRSKRHCGSRYACEYCPDDNIRVFDSFELLNTHMDECHPLRETTCSYFCFTCFESMITPHQQSTHRKRGHRVGVYEQTLLVRDKVKSKK